MHRMCRTSDSQNSFELNLARAYELERRGNKLCSKEIRLVRQLVDVLQEQNPDHEPALGRRPAVIAEQIRDLVVEPVPVDLVGQPNELMPDVDDLVEP